MLNDKMSLHEMMYFKPEDSDMLSMPLEALVYVKVFATSNKDMDNVDFVSYLHDTDLKEDLYEYESTNFYQFSSPNKDRFITIFELYGNKPYQELSEHFLEVMSNYSHNSDVVIDMFTHDSHLYRLSDLAGEIKLDQLN